MGSAHKGPVLVRSRNWYCFSVLLKVETARTKAVLDLLAHQLVPFQEQMLLCFQEAQPEPVRTLESTLAFHNACDKLSRKKFDELTEFVKVYKAKALAYLKYDKDAFTGSLNNALPDEEKAALRDFLNLQNGDVVLMVADKKAVAEVALGAVRKKLGEELGLIDHSKFCFEWITEFPMYEYSEEEGRWVSAHHPFTAPRDEDVDKLMSDQENCYSRAYDLVLNGYELLSGSVRIHDSQMQAKVFDALGLSEEQIKNKFGFFIEAFQYGAPPHCGVGIGLERLVMILSGTDNIKDVVAFPKTASAYCLMSDAPNFVDQDQLDFLSLEIRKD